MSRHSRINSQSSPCCGVRLLHPRHSSVAALLPHATPHFFHQLPLSAALLSRSGVINILVDSFCTCACTDCHKDVPPSKKSGPKMRPVLSNTSHRTIDQRGCSISHPINVGRNIHVLQIALVYGPPFVSKQTCYSPISYKRQPPHNAKTIFQPPQMSSTMTRLKHRSTRATPPRASSLQHKLCNKCNMARSRKLCKNTNTTPRKKY